MGQIDVVNYLISFGGVALIAIGADLYSWYIHRHDARERDAKRLADADASSRPTS